MITTSRLQRLLRDPLLHFLLIGAVLFLGISAVQALKRPTVRISAQELEQLATYWEMQTQRPPTREELRAIIRERVEEELLAREALRLGMDRDDMILRRRLAQKMSFASQDIAAIPEPSARTLAAYYERTKARYATPSRVALRHVFFNRDRPGDARQAAQAALAEAKAGGQPVGDPSLLPQTYADITLVDLARDYGPGFEAAAREAPAGAWVGPVESPYGFHLIQVQSRRAGETPPLSEVRDEVRAAWIDERRKANNQAFIRRLWRRYDVQIADLPP